MQFRNVGASGLRVTTVGLGCNNLGGRLDRDASIAVVQAALDDGITLFDTADRYPVTGAGRSEELLGEALGSRRDEVIVASKFGLPMDGPSGRLRGASRRYIVEAVERSLRRLKTDYIDLYQIHTPDPLTPIEETLRALDDLVRQGKVRYVGASNFAGWQIIDAVWTSRHHGLPRFVSTQIEYSVLARDPETELLPALDNAGVGLLPYFPLASGVLTGKYQPGAASPDGTRLASQGQLRDKFFTEANIELAARLDTFARERGHTILELAFGWLLARGAVSSVIAGASNAKQVRANVEATSWTFTADDLAEVDRLTGAVPVAAH